MKFLCLKNRRLNIKLNRSIIIPYFSSINAYTLHILYFFEYVFS